MRALKAIVVAILTAEARMLLARHKPQIIAITGSVGKTTTKDAIYAALKDSLHVRKSEKSFNSDVGVPLAILGLENAWRNPLRWLWNIVQGLWLVVVGSDYPDWLVLEVGADRPGDIRSIAAWLKPDVVVITGVPEIPVHVEYFKSREDLMLEKRSLAEHVKPGGTIVVNGDDGAMTSLCKELGAALLTYGFEEGNDVRATEEEIAYDDAKPIGMRFYLERSGMRMPVSVHGALGRPRIYAALAAYAVAELLHVDTATLGQALSEWAPPPGRMRILDGMRGSIIIDDTYNSSPAAALSALDTLEQLAGKRKIVAMGDMLELGKYSAEAHRNVGVCAAAIADMLITVGFRARAIAEAALDEGMKEKFIRHYEHSESRRAGEELKHDIKEGDIVLVKGSQSMRMERTVYELLADPAHASELLVRYDPDWIAR